MSSAAAEASIPASKRSRACSQYVAQISLDVAHAGGVGDGPVSGHQDIGSEREDPVAGHQPVAEVRPHHRRPVNEQQIAGEHGGAVGYVNDRVAGGVRGPQLDQRDLAVADAQLEPVVERLRRRPDRDPLELERTERVLDERGQVVGQAGGGLERVQQLGRDRLRAPRPLRATRRSWSRPAAARCRSSGRDWRGCSSPRRSGAPPSPGPSRPASRASAAGRTACRPAARCPAP